MDTTTFDFVFGLVSYAIRLLGFVVFGLAAGWLTLNILGRKANPWQVELTILVCFFGLMGAIVNFTTAGATGAYALGAGLSLLIWGMRAESAGESKAKAK